MVIHMGGYQREREDYNSTSLPPFSLFLVFLSLPSLPREHFLHRLFILSSSFLSYLFVTRPFRLYLPPFFNFLIPFSFPFLPPTTYQPLLFPFTPFHTHSLYVLLHTVSHCHSLRLLLHIILYSFRPSLQFLVLNSSVLYNRSPLLFIA